MGFNLGKELNKLKEFAIDAAPYAMMAAPFIPGVNAGVMSLMGKYAPWMQKAMQSKFMNSIMGASLKDAGISYLQAKMLGKDNPHLMAQNALTRNLFLNANKVGWDWNQMMGGDPTTLPALADRVIEGSPATIGTRMGPGYEEYGQAMMDKYYGPGRGGFEFSSLPPAAETISAQNFYDNWSPMTVDKANKITGGWEGIDLPERGNIINWIEEPAQEAFTIPGKDIQGPLDELAMADVKNPLAGTGFLTTTKTGPDMFDKLLGRVRDAKDANIVPGSDEWNEMFGIGKVGVDKAKAAGWLWDYFSNPQTKGDIEEKEQEDYEDFMARLMWPRSMDDVPDFKSAFLGNQGGIASFANGGMGPYSNPYPDDDPNVDVQDIIQGPGFESIDELGSLFGDPDEMASTPHPMEGWYDMFFDTFGRYPNNEAELIQFINEADVDLQQTGRAIGPAGASTVSEDGTRMMEMAAQGGRMGYYGGGDLNAIPGGVVSGPGTETSDSIPAQLSNNEFVVTADAVRAAGGGDIDLGAQKFYGIMNALDPNSAKPGEPPVYS